MEKYIKDERTILSLDAGGTNFVFSAIKGGELATPTITLPAETNNIEACLKVITNGFNQIKKQLTCSPDAISFAFPGPADYENGIIGDLPNFPAFKGGVPLGPALEEAFNIPVFINNDGNLFAYGEALAGFLPDLNKKLESYGSKKCFSNLIGITLGTGFGCGITINNQLLMGDSSCAAEIHNTLNAENANWNAEESVSTRAIQRVYSEKCGKLFSIDLMPKDIYNIAKGFKDGNKTAALEAFAYYGKSLGNSIANIISIIDGIVVIGGGITAGYELIAPAMFSAINKPIVNYKNQNSQKLSIRVFNLEDANVFNEFAKGNSVELVIPNSEKTIYYDSMQRTGIGLSKLGTSKAVMIGAYAYALEKLNKSTL